MVKLSVSTNGNCSSDRWKRTRKLSLIWSAKQTHARKNTHTHSNRVMLSVYWHWRYNFLLLSRSYVFLIWTVVSMWKDMSALASFDGTNILILIICYYLNLRCDVVSRLHSRIPFEIQHFASAASHIEKFIGCVCCHFYLILGRSSDNFISLQRTTQFHYVHEEAKRKFQHRNFVAKKNFWIWDSYSMSNLRFIVQWLFACIYERIHV